MQLYRKASQNRNLLRACHLCLGRFLSFSGLIGRDPVSDADFMNNIVPQNFETLVNEFENIIISRP